MLLENTINGEANMYSTEFRMFDARLGRWLSLDPLMDQFPWMSPFVGMDNNPIFFTDPYGLNTIEKDTKDYSGGSSDDGGGKGDSKGGDKKKVKKPNPFPKKKLGSRYYYKIRHNDFVKRHKEDKNVKTPSYYLDYGDKYLKRFSDETNDKLTDEGKVWLNEVRGNLQELMEKGLKENPNIETDDKKFTSFAFDTHVEAYLNENGTVPITQLNTLDLVRILLTPDAKDLLSEDGKRQADEMFKNLSKYWLENPSIGIRRTSEFVMYAAYIEGLVLHKIIKEGLNSKEAEEIRNYLKNKIKI